MCFHKLLNYVVAIFISVKIRNATIYSSGFKAIYWYFIKMNFEKSVTVEFINIGEDFLTDILLYSN